MDLNEFRGQTAWFRSSQESGGRTAIGQHFGDSEWYAAESDDYRTELLDVLTTGAPGLLDQLPELTGDDKRRDWFAEVAVALQPPDADQEYDVEQAELAAAEPDVAEPDVAEPDVAEPDVAEPNAVEPDAVEPDAVEPDAVEPAWDADWGMLTWDGPDGYRYALSEDQQTPASSWMSESQAQQAFPAWDEGWQMLRRYHPDAGWQYATSDDQAKPSGAWVAEARAAEVRKEAQQAAESAMSVIEPDNVPALAEELGMAPAELSELLSQLPGNFKDMVEAETSALAAEVAAAVAGSE